MPNSFGRKDSGKAQSVRVWDIQTIKIAVALAEKGAIRKST